MMRMPKWWPGVACMVALGWCATDAPAQQRGADLVKPQLLADVSAVQPGKPFRVGLLLRIAPHWHVYWKNPGDSGQAVTATFDLPPGFTVSDLQYPVPTKFLQPGDLVAYGYADEVMLLGTITPPADIPASGNIPIQAKLKYLVCDSVCLPGKADLSLTLPASNQAAPANEEAFAEWSRQIPAAGDAAKAIADVKPAARADNQYAVDIAWKQPADNVEFFPGKSRTLNVQDVTVTNKGNQTHVTFTAAPLAGQQPDVAALDSVVVYTDDRGIRRGIEVAVPIKADRK